MKEPLKTNSPSCGPEDSVENLRLSHQNHSICEWNEEVRSSSHKTAVDREAASPVPCWACPQLFNPNNTTPTLFTPQEEPFEHRTWHNSSQLTKKREQNFLVRVWHRPKLIPTSGTFHWKESRNEAHWGNSNFFQLDIFSFGPWGI